MTPCFAVVSQSRRLGSHLKVVGLVVGSAAIGAAALLSLGVWGLLAVWLGSAFLAQRLLSRRQAAVCTIGTGIVLMTFHSTMIQITPSHPVIDRLRADVLSGMVLGVCGGIVLWSIAAACSRGLRSLLGRR